MESKPVSRGLTELPFQMESSEAYIKANKYRALLIQIAYTPRLKFEIQQLLEQLPRSEPAAVLANGGDTACPNFLTRAEAQADKLLIDLDLVCEKLQSMLMREPQARRATAKMYLSLRLSCTHSSVYWTNSC